MIVTEHHAEVMSDSLRRVRRLLRPRGYGLAELATIERYCREHRTAEGCPGLEAEHAAMVEALLPLDPKLARHGLGCRGLAPRRLSRPTRSRSCYSSGSCRSTRG